MAYSQNIYTQTRQGFLQEGQVTPDNKYHEGIDSTGRVQVASFLPILRKDEEKFTNIVISSGTPVAFYEDRLVPAGYKLELEAVKGGAQPTIKYTLLDVQAKIRNAQGVVVTEGEGVVTSILAKDADAAISGFVGLVNTNCFEFAGGDGHNPANYKYTNFNPQPQVSFNMQYVYEVPLVTDDAQYAAAPLRGITAMIGSADEVKPGMFLTYNKDSNFVLAATDFTSGGLDASVLVGQLYRVHKVCDPTDPTKVINPVNDLQHVVSPENFSGNPLNNIPGTVTKGVPQKIFFANGHGYAVFKLNTR